MSFTSTLNYGTYQQAIATMMATSVTDPDFLVIFPQIITYAEERIYRELDILNTRFRDSTQVCTAGQRQISLPSSLYVAETIAVISPAGDTPTQGTRNILIPCQHDFLDMVYPSDATASQGLPIYFAMLTQTTALVGPCPDAAYVIEVVGTQRPTALSSTNPTTPLTELLPDLFFAASMIFASAYQKNFGSQADDPKMAQSWEQQYQMLLMTAQSEEFRKRFQASSWTSMINSPVANRQRG